MQSLPLHAAPYLFIIDFGVAALSLLTTMGTAGRPKNEFSYTMNTTSENDNDHQRFAKAIVFHYDP